MTAEVVRSLKHITTFLHDARLFPEASAITHQLVVAIRRSAKTAPEIYYPYLAAALFEYGRPLHKAHERRAAASVREEALKIKQHLSHDDPTVHSSDLSTYLTELAQSLYDFGQYQETYNINSKAVSIARGLRNSNPNSLSLTKDLARSSREPFGLPPTTEAVRRGVGCRCRGY